jgi:glutathionyl-hydroquinone reductase
VSRETVISGRFERQASVFREWVSADGSTPYAVVPGRYQLYISWACPWAHRTAIGRLVMGLEDAIGLSVADPIRDERGWRFSGGEYTDPVNGFEFLAEAYEATRPGYDARVSTPVLWDKETQRVVNNESGDILRTLGTVFAPLAEHPVDLYPARLAERIDAVEEELYHGLNNAVYRAGFARSQEAYEDDARRVFAMLDVLEHRLGESRYLMGPSITEVDWRAFTTLVRFDAVYYSHFKCNLRRVVDLPAVWGYTRDLYQQPGIAATVRMDDIKAHYYGTHPSINPNGIVPIGPELDFTAPQGRDALGA